MKSVDANIDFLLFNRLIGLLISVLRSCDGEDEVVDYLDTYNRDWQISHELMMLMVTKLADDDDDQRPMMQSSGGPVMQLHSYRTALPLTNFSLLMIIWE